MMQYGLIQLRISNIPNQYVLRIYALLPTKSSLQFVTLMNSQFHIVWFNVVSWYIGYV